MDIVSNVNKGVLFIYDKTNNPEANYGVWNDCPWLVAGGDPSYATIYDLKLDERVASSDAIRGHVVTKATAGKIGYVDAVGNEMYITPDSVTAHQGLNIQKRGEIFKIATGKNLWMEAEVKIDVVNKMQLFIGLAKTDTTLMPSGSLDNSNAEYLGFALETGAAGTPSIFSCLATAEVSDELAALTDNTWVKLGLKVSGAGVIKAYVDGAEVALTNVVAAALPTTELTPSIVVQSGASTSSNLYIRSFKVFQLR
jgi:hypothetical protein